MFECDKVGTAVPAVLSDSGALDKPRNTQNTRKGHPEGTFLSPQRQFEIFTGTRMSPFLWPSAWF